MGLWMTELFYLWGNCFCWRGGYCVSGDMVLGMCAGAFVNTAWVDWLNNVNVTGINVRDIGL